MKEVGLEGRAGSLVDWESESENRVYVSTYAAENNLNWRVERINGWNIPTLVVLHETVSVAAPSSASDDFEPTSVEQIRVLRLVRDAQVPTEARPTMKCVVEMWRPEATAHKRGRTERPKCQLVETRTPLRLGKPLPLIPFIFHGPRHSRPEIDKLPLADVIAV